MINTRQTVEAGETPAEITISMIEQDLKDGVNKTEMSIKYGIKPWEVDEMFKHPLLKGRRPARKRTLSFSFVDDISEEPIKEIIETVDPNQVTLEQAIDEAIDAVEEVKEQMQETQEAILDILSPTEFEDNQTRVEEGLDHKGEYEEEDDDLEIPTLEDTLDLVKEQELEMDENSFEL